MADSNEDRRSLEQQIASLQSIVAHLLLRNQQLRDQGTASSDSATCRANGHHETPRHRPMTNHPPFEDERTDNV